MDLGVRSPLLDFFKRGEVAKDVRLLAATGQFAPRALEQVALLALLSDDGDADVRAAAEATLKVIPDESMAGFLGRSDVPEGLREFFRARGIEPLPGADAADDPLDRRRCRQRGIRRRRGRGGLAEYRRKSWP